MLATRSRRILWEVRDPSIDPITTRRGRVAAWRTAGLVLLLCFVLWDLYRKVRGADPKSLLGRRISWPLTKAQIGPMLGVVALGAGYILIVTSSGVPIGLPLGIALCVGGLVALGLGWRSGRTT